MRTVSFVLSHSFTPITHDESVYVNIRSGQELQNFTRDSGRFFATRSGATHIQVSKFSLVRQFLYTSRYQNNPHFMAARGTLLLRTIVRGFELSRFDSPPAPTSRLTPPRSNIPSCLSIVLALRWRAPPTESTGSSSFFGCVCGGLLSQGCQTQNRGNEEREKESESRLSTDGEVQRIHKRLGRTVARIWTTQLRFALKFRAL